LRHWRQVSSNRPTQSLLRASSGAKVQLSLGRGCISRSSGALTQKKQDSKCHSKRITKASQHHSCKEKEESIMKTHYLLTGDIGGTNSRLGLYDISSHIPLYVKIFENEIELKEGAADGIFARKIVAPFLKECWENVSGLAPMELTEIVACLACAGPVSSNKCVLSNRGNVVVDGNEILEQKYYKDPYLSMLKVCKLINDFVAQGYGCLTLEPSEVRELMPDSHSKIDVSRFIHDWCNERVLLSSFAHFFTFSANWTESMRGCWHWFRRVLLNYWPRWKLRVLS
jgi:hypothetical protein